MSVHTQGLSLLDDQQSGPNCGVTAIAILTGQPFKRVFEVMKMVKNGNWKGRTHDQDRARAIKALGFKAWTTKTEAPHPSLWQFAIYTAERDQSYMVLVPGHAVVIRNQMVQDQNGIFPIKHYNMRNRRVDEYSILTPDTQPETVALDSFLNSF